MAQRRNFTSEQKVSILREHLVEKVPVSVLTDKYKIHAVQLYQWQKRFFEEGAAVFDRKPNSANERRREDAQGRKIEQLEARIQQKDTVMAELLEEYVAIKKANGEP